MGCGASVSPSVQLFKQTEAKTPSQAIDQPECKGKRLVILGRVAADTEVIMPPFGADDAVAIKVSASKIAPGTGTRTNEFLFSGFSAVDFKIRDETGNEIRVDAKLPGSWKFQMLETHVAWNVARDSSKGGMVSGGTETYQFSKQELRPNAEAFWNEFCDGKDEWNGVTDMEKLQGSSEGGGLAIASGAASYSALSNVMRKAKEASIKAGDAVAVLGTLKTDDMGMFLEGGDGAIITNIPEIAKQLTSIPTFEIPNVSVLPAKVSMTRGRGLCLARSNQD